MFLQQIKLLNSYSHLAVLNLNSGKIKKKGEQGRQPTWWTSLTGIWKVLLGNIWNSCGFPGYFECELGVRYRVPWPFKTMKISSHECLCIGVRNPGANVWSHTSIYTWNHSDETKVNSSSSKPNSQYSQSINFISISN